MSKDLAQRVEIKKLPNSSTDHLPVLAKFESIQKKKKIYTKEIKKRSMKNFSAQKWQDTLATKD